jgi:CxxC motif-containing protein (DUF1111 family)
VIPAGRHPAHPAAALGAALCFACGGGSGVGTSALAGGRTTVFDRTSSAYSLPAPGLSGAELATHLAGDVAFEAVFVTAPAPVNPGLGPLFNNDSCAACHQRDGRGMPVIGSGPLRSSLLVRVSTTDGLPLPGLGSQLQDHAVYGVTPEATVEVGWVEQPGTYGDGAPFSLRSPTILWHGGEAEASREAFRGANAAEREALLRFLRSL